MPTEILLGHNLASDKQGSDGYMGIVIDPCSGDSDVDISMTYLCGILYEPFNLKGYASRI